MRDPRARLDDALDLSRSALTLAEWARDLAHPGAAENELSIAEHVVFLAAHITATATAVIDHHRLEGTDPR
jgi:hypothetical protein